jgi:hypothetical protein
MINLADFTLSSFVNPFVIMVALALGVIVFALCRMDCVKAGIWSGRSGFILEARNERPAQKLDEPKQIKS